MNIRIVMLFALLLLPSTVHADVDKIVGPLSCGIYDQMVKSFIQAELDTQHRNGLDTPWRQRRKAAEG